TEPPVIMCHEDKIISTEPYVKYAKPTATDNYSSNPTVSCHPESGSGFQIGETRVVCKAVDEVNNAASCSFLVTVENYIDVFPPSFTCPMNIVSKSQSPEWVIPEATDDRTQSPLVECSESPSQEYPIGSVNEITCTMSDDAGNGASCTFTISIGRWHNVWRSHIVIKCL
ncbi:hyalin-like, partial [Anneissia japonica]|uniref:hyalin-like n=1 Tax=Anneissia japonica TaxID=1529436 RepID=UPI00142579AC